MGLRYDSSQSDGNRWIVAKEKTDYDTQQRTTDLSATDNAEKYRQGVIDWYNSIGKPVQWTKDNQTQYNLKANEDNINKSNNQIISENNNSIIASNAANDVLNKKNSAKNKSYDAVMDAATRVNKGEYVDKREIIRNVIKNLPDLTEDEKKSLQSNLETHFKSFYKTEKLEKWDTNLGAKPLDGDFEPGFYKKQNNGQAAQEWQKAVDNDDVDIVDRYGEEGFYLQHYTNIGKKAGVRGNAVKPIEAASNYKELKPTDTDIAAVRDLQLGIPNESQSDRLLGIKEVADAWEAAKNNDPYWSQLAKEKYLDPTDKEQFTILFRLSNRPEDKQVAFKYNLNTGSGITELEDAINQAGGEKMQVDVKKFSVLRQNVLKDTMAEMKKAKAQEQNLSLYKGFSTFGDILNVNKQLTDSILGDTGVGGILSLTSGGKAEENLQKGMEKLTGIKNNVTYNWQKWFDETLKTKYDQDLSLGYKEQGIEKQINIDKEFAKNYIDGYLKPRFDTSRSMDEFNEYLNVRQEEQNPFQTQDLINAMQLTADTRAKAYLDQVQKSDDKFFDSDFYFNPVGDKARETAYADQKATVEKDWEEAKAAIAANKGDSYWEQQAYRFGVDVNDKTQFARMHFQVKGQGQGYDAAEDILNASKVSDEIYTKILPALKTQAEKSGMTPWVNFIKPEEFADEVLKGVDPTTNKEAWDEILKRYGISDFKGTVDELKSYITESLRSDTATQIRKEIKYLNEKKQDPTQQSLGVTYIDRPEDYKTGTPPADTELYKIFQKAGFQGTEESFYKDFMPDVNQEDMKFLNLGATNKSLSFSGFNPKDPYEALSTLESLNEDTASTSKKETTKEEDSPFKIDIDSTEDTGSEESQSFLGNYASLFKKK